MAKFMAMGSAGGAGATITVTYSSEFYGQTLTATNGTETHTATATSSGSTEFSIENGGTWVVSATIDGQTYSTTVTVDIEYTATLEAIPDGSTVTPTDDIQTWLKCAGIRDKTTYTTLADVLADTETFIALCADSNACDYMARSTTWALAEGSVPTMTSNTTPSGECSASSVYNTGYEAYKAFTGNNTDEWAASSSSTPAWIQYKFAEPTCVSRFSFYQGTSSGHVKISTFKIQGSNTGNSDDWTDLYSATAPDNTSQRNVSGYFDNATSYLYYRLYITGLYVSSTVSLSALQFYTADITTNSTAMLIVGKYNYCANKLLSNSTWSEALVNSTYWAYVFDVTVPKMTSNSAPSGLAFASSTYDSNYPAYKAFNGDSSNGWNARANPVFPEYLGYIFTQKIRLSEIALDTGGTRRVYTFKIQGSNDTTNGTDGTWADVSEVITTPDSGYNKTYPINGDGEYKAYRLYIVTGTTVTGNLNIATLQFYGRTDNANYIPLVPKMTSNTTPSGVAFGKNYANASNQYFNAFDNSYDHAWTGAINDVTNQYVGYTFPSPVKAVYARCEYQGKRIHQYKIQATNIDNPTDNDWTDISSVYTNTDTSYTFFVDWIPLSTDVTYKSYRAFVIDSTSEYVSISKLQFYKEPTVGNVIIHSAVEDSIFYMDDGSPVALCGIPVGDTIDVDLDAYKGQTLTLVSTVAKDPTNLSNDFTMPVRITPNITEIYLMPIGALYWWGYVNKVNPVIAMSSADGWEQSPAVSQITFNTNNITNSGNSVSGFATTNKISSMSKIISIAQGSTGWGATKGQTLYSSNWIRSELSGTLSKQEIAIPDTDGYYVGSYKGSGSYSSTFNALWYE